MLISKASAGFLIGVQDKSEMWAKQSNPLTFTKAANGAILTTVPLTISLTSIEFKNANSFSSLSLSLIAFSSCRITFWEATICFLLGLDSTLPSSALTLKVFPTYFSKSLAKPFNLIWEDGINTE